MIHAEEGQVITYDNPTDSDMKQYKDIPKK